MGLGGGGGARCCQGSFARINLGLNGNEVSAVAARYSRLFPLNKQHVSITLGGREGGAEEMPV